MLRHCHLLDQGLKLLLTCCVPRAQFASGVAIAEFPAGGYLSFHQLADLTPAASRGTQQDAESREAGSESPSATSSVGWGKHPLRRVPVIAGCVAARVEPCAGCC